MVWFAASDFRFDLDRPLPLVSSSRRAATGELMFTTLDAARQALVTACTVSSLMGVQAGAVGVDWSITLLSRSFVQEECRS